MISDLPKVYRGVLVARLAERRKCCSLSWYRILAGAAQIPFGDERSARAIKSHNIDIPVVSP